jgi:hypothetical protein
MTREDFVKAIKSEALDTAVRDTIMDLEDPPGRKPEASLTEIHDWYQTLDPKSRKFVEQVARMASESATFGVMAILDGVRAFESGENKGTLVLEYRNGADRLLLNNFQEKLLHEILASWFNVISSPQNLPVDLHHVPQSHVMTESIPGYDPMNATAIALPTREHKNIPVSREEEHKSPRQQLDKDLQDLRDYTQVPDSVIQKLASEVRI